MWRPLLLAVALLTVPLAASAPIAYVGRGSGTVEPPYGSLDGCDHAEVAVGVYAVPDGWALHAHDVDDTASAGVPARVPCNYRHQLASDGVPFTPVDTILGPGGRLEGDPETGFVLVFEYACSTSTYTLGPLGPATAFDHARVPLCGDPDGYLWVNTTLAFTAVG